VDIEKCIACGTCAEKCPKKVDDSYNEGLSKRKAIYVKYSQAVPLKYGIDKENCIYFQKGKCKACEKFCPAGAILFDDKEREITLEVGSIILAPGFKSFDPKLYDTYSYIRLPNVVTSLEFERILSATGPFMGHLLRPSDKKEPEKIAWLQCVGSRDINRCDNGYCSSVCCMYAIKQAIIAREHSKRPLDCAIFFMDMRTHGKDFERYYENARSRGIRFIRSRIHSIEPYSEDNGLLLSYIEEDGTFRQESFDMVVLSVGLEIDKRVVELSKRLGIELNQYNFVRTDIFSPVCTSVPGIYVCGAFTGPKDIPQSVMEASAAACASSMELKESRWKEAIKPSPRPEEEISYDIPKIGVFVCNCGANIGSVVDVPSVVEYAKTFKNVIHAEENLFTCSQDTQDKMRQVIKEKGINRVVVAACSPMTHETLFQETLSACGINRYMFEMANIRNHNSWVHRDAPEIATKKAKDLLRGAIARVERLRPLKERVIPINKRALVIGGGIAGMSASLGLADQGFEVVLVEREPQLGGFARNINKTIEGEDIQSKLAELIDRVNHHENIQVLTQALVVGFSGFKGNFTTELLVGPGMYERKIDHGVLIIATGATEYVPKEFGYGKDPSIITQTQLERVLEERGADDLKRVVMIQCVGSRNEEYPNCSRVCCQSAIKNALEIKRLNPSTEVFILYRDIRAYGLLEDYYRMARREGVLFFRYEQKEPPEVETGNGKLRVRFKDHILDKVIDVEADLVVLSAGMRATDTDELAGILKLPRTEDGYFMEAHVKLRPVDLPNEAVYVCGTAHGPKLISESISQALAAASRAATFLSQDSITLSVITAKVDQERCAGCLICVRVCPYGVPKINKEGKSEIDPALCRGCGVCAAECPAKVIQLNWYEDDQIMSKVEAILEGVL